MDLRWRKLSSTPWNKNRKLTETRNFAIPQTNRSDAQGAVSVEILLSTASAQL